MVVVLVTRVVDVGKTVVKVDKTVVEVDETGVPPRADWMALSSTGYTREAIIASPAAFGWTPSLKADVGYPVAQSAIVMGESVVFKPLAHAGMALFIAVMPAVEPIPNGMTRSTLNQC